MISKAAEKRSGRIVLGIVFLIIVALIIWHQLTG